MAITLVMMAAVVTVFANVSESIRNRRATTEMNGQIRHVRGVLQRDLAGHTCSGLPWTRPESNQGYIEIIEGPQSDYDPSVWLTDANNDGEPDAIGGASLDLATSALPGSITSGATDFFLPNGEAVTTSNAVTNGGGLGDWDDILALTVRNENEPFVGRIPAAGVPVGGFSTWGTQAVESTLAEVVWFSVENPVEADPSFYFGEPGFRTVYRRALLIAPQLNYSFNVGGGQVTGPGVVRVLSNRFNQTRVDQALAALISFQEKYDLSVRLEWNPQLDSGRWTIVANSLSDLTKRENRYEHHGYAHQSSPSRNFPFAAASAGAGVTVNDDVAVLADAEYGAIPAATIGEVASLASGVTFNLSDPSAPTNLPTRPLAYLTSNPNVPCSVRAIRDENNRIVGFTTGYVPLGGARRGEDVMMTDALAFDLRIFDPKAPLLSNIPIAGDTILEPGDPGWSSLAANTTTQVVGRGAYVDLSMWNAQVAFSNRRVAAAAVSTPRIDSFDDEDDAALTGVDRSNWRVLLRRSKLAMAPNRLSGLSPIVRPRTGGSLGAFEPYRTYDTWSTHYENNGVNEDNQFGPDQGTDGFDNNSINGPDDPGERETAPPYDVPLHGIQVTLRGYERDSRQIREVKIKQTFVPH